MAYKPPLSEGDLYKLNIRSIRKWIEDNKGRIKAKPNETVLYSGRTYELDNDPDLPKEERELYQGTPIWKLINKHRKLHSDRKVPFKYQNLEGVLKGIRDYPQVVDKDHQEKKFNNAFDFFSSIKSLDKLLPNAKAVNKESWDRLSEVFAANAEGDIKILDGFSDEFEKLGHEKTLFTKEVEALLKSSKLSPAGRAVLLKKITKYGELFDHQYTKMIKTLDEETRNLKKPKMG